MKKVIFALAIVMAAQVASAADTSKEGADIVYAEAIPLSKIPAIVDQDGCLWGVVKKDHQLAAIAILDGSGKQMCRPAK